MCCLAFSVQPATAQRPSDGPPLRTQAVLAARTVVDAAGHRFAAPLYLVVQGDSADMIAGGFSEVLTESGVTPRLGSSDGTQGTLLRIQRVLGGLNGFETFDVRVDRLPERTVIYSRLLTPGDGNSQDEGQGILERMIVPAAAIGAAVLTIYLLFTVRS